MCGIVGYIGARDATQIVLDGLQRLAYRGYDSAGVAVLNGSGIEVRRDVGRLENLTGRVASDPIAGQIGIGHTRWATHGAPAERNAHPHVSMTGDFVLVHNGIVENYQELREQLVDEGVTFTSETDTEVIVQLIERYAHNGLGNNLLEITRKAVRRLRGAHAIVIMSKAQPDRIVAVRIGNAGGIAIGMGDSEAYIASDIPAILEYTRDMVFLEDAQIAVIRQGDFAVSTLDGDVVTPDLHRISWDPVSAAKGEFKHFMQKEIFEQARSVTDTLGGRIDLERNEVMLPDLNLTPERAQRLSRLVILACGTSYYSGLIGKFFIERIARLPVEVDYASEYRYRDPIVDDTVAALAITQSGETVDTLAAIEEARDKGATIWSIVNVIGSQAMRLADGFIGMNAGPEIGVASTKAFTASIVDQYLLAVYLAQLRGLLSDDERAQLIHDIAKLPTLIGAALEQDALIERIAGELYHHTDFLFLGRGINYPIALEGALKLKEISYIHAEGYPAGEMKHGPIALVDENMPIVVIATRDHLYEKVVSQVEQAKARGGVVIAIATEGDDAIAELVDYVLYIPECPPYLSPALTVLPLQLLAYHVAVWRGADVDQPRNLAKSVTVE